MLVNACDNFGSFDVAARNTNLELVTKNKEFYAANAHLKVQAEKIPGLIPFHTIDDEHRR
jgi:hypothetical protein